MKTGGRWFLEVEFYLQSAKKKNGVKTWMHMHKNREWLKYYRLTIKTWEQISSPHCPSSFKLSGCVRIFFRSSWTEFVCCSALTLMCTVRSYNIREPWHITQLNKWGQPREEHDRCLSTFMMLLLITQWGTLPTHYVVVLILCLCKTAELIIRLEKHCQHADIFLGAEHDRAKVLAESKEDD